MRSRWTEYIHESAGKKWISISVRDLRGAPRSSVSMTARTASDPNAANLVSSSWTSSSRVDVPSWGTAARRTHSRTLIISSELYDGEGHDGLRDQRLPLPHLSLGDDEPLS